MSKKVQDLKEIESTLIQKAKNQKRSAPEVAWNIRALGGYGWYIGLPLVVAVVIGTVLDKHFPKSPAFWTLISLGIGFIIGLINAHLWLIREVKAIRQKGEK